MKLGESHVVKAKPNLFGMSQEDINDKLKYQGAYRYAKFDCSDPFALARATSHIRNGVAQPSDYGADEDAAGRLSSVHRA